MDWLLIGVGILFLVCIIVGYVRGILRIGVSLLATIASIILVMLLTPYVSTAIGKWTPINSMVESKCSDVFKSFISNDSLKDIDLSGTSLEGLDSDELESVDLKNKNLSMDDISKILGEVPKDMQISAIENSDFPKFLQNALLSNNNSEVYKELGVDAFPQYIAKYISKILIQIVAFLITFLLVTVIVRALIVAVDIISDLPVIGLVTRITGALAGAFMALLIVWVFFLVVTAMSTSSFGKDCFAQISQSSILLFLYEHNYILKFLMSF